MTPNLSSKFITTVTNTWGAQGQQWLDQLPDLIEKINIHWQLTDIQPVENMSYHFVSHAIQENQPVVIKVGCDNKPYQSEKATLQHFNGHGSVKLLDAFDDYQALLLDKISPGNTLKEARLPIEEKIKAVADIIDQLSSIALSDKKFRDCEQWCGAIDRVADPRIKPEYVKKSQHLRDYLLSTMEESYVCHGDLHFDNILQQGDAWVSIDPHGVIGDKAFEAAAFDFIQPNEKADECLMDTRITMLAEAVGVPYERLLAWVFLRCVVSAQWFIEDDGEPSQRISEVEVLYSLLS